MRPFRAIILLLALGAVAAVASPSLPPTPPVPHKATDTATKGAGAAALLTKTKTSKPLTVTPKPVIITVTWTNPSPPPTWPAGCYKSCLVTSTNIHAPLSNWTLAAKLPYQPACSETFTNPPAPSFWRAYNALVP